MSVGPARPDPGHPRKAEKEARGIRNFTAQRDRYQQEGCVPNDKQKRP